MNLEKELSTSLELMDMGIDAELHRGDDGTVSVRPRQARMGATGFDLQVPLRQEMSQAEPQAPGQAMEELPAVVGGLAAGATSATVGLPGDIAALAAGAYNAIFPEGDEGRLEAFTNTLTEISDKYGSGAVKGFIQQQAEDAGLSDVQMQALDEAMMVGEFGGIGGVAKAAVTKGPQILSKVGDVIEGAGDAAKARMADADGSVTLGMNIDPDPAIAAAGDAVKAMRGGVEAPELNASLKPPTETEPGVIAFHGSGADFDEFKLEKIGTGEGAQAYGYGLYFTDSEDIARFYRQTVGGGAVVKDWSIGDLDLVKKENYRDYSPGATPFGRGPYKPVSELSRADYAQSLMSENLFIRERELFSEVKTPYGIVNEPLEGDELKAAIVDIIEDTKDNIDEDNFEGLAYLDEVLEDIKSGRSDIKFDAEQLGKTYKVAIEPKPEDMLDYQATFADQPKKVQDALKAIGYEVEKNLVGQKNPKSQIDLAMKRPMPVILDNLKKMFESENWQNELYGRGDRIISEKLLEQGIPGIKYRAGGSRGASVDAADAKMNYVVFDDKMIKILEKYGIVGPVAIGAATASQQEGEVDDAGA